jgi:hypothetical protein
MDISIDTIISIIKCSDEYTDDEINFLVKNIRHIEDAFLKRYKKEIVIKI